MNLTLPMFKDTRYMATCCLITGSNPPFPVSVAAVSSMSSIVSDAVKVFSDSIRRFSALVPGVWQCVHTIPEGVCILPHTKELIPVAIPCVSPHVHTFSEADSVVPELACIFPEAILSSPDVVLSIAGSDQFIPGGPIHAHEVVVNTTGADFVFEPSYKLRSLSELETFIRTNKHLPDIAPAKEMQENGLSTGEMQAKLLQKVEELTLYTIEQNKAIEELRQTVEAQNKKIEKLVKDRK